MKKKSEKKTYTIYKIELGGICRYIGLTDNLRRRQSQHRRDSKKDDLTKSLYKMKRQLHQDEEITLQIVHTTDKKIEAIRLEAYLILRDHFLEGNLWQSPPHIIKYF